jgi:hypothetical protein
MNSDIDEVMPFMDDSESNEEALAPSTECKQFPIAPTTAAHLNQSEVTLGAESWQVFNYYYGLIQELSSFLRKCPVWEARTFVSSWGVP